MKVLHVVTDLDSDMAYGGPASNCVMHSSGQALKNVDVTILSTFRTQRMSESETNANLILLKARQYFKSKPFVFQFSFRFLLMAILEIRKTDVVHIHFAREINPVLTALIARILGKPYVLQTHGMMKRKSLKSHKMWDFLLSKPIVKNASLVLALQETEREQLKIEFQVHPKLLGNGVSREQIGNVRNSIETGDSYKTIIFLARVHPRKRPELFVRAGLRALDNLPTHSLEIYGVKSNGSDSFFEFLKQMKLEAIYKGGIPHDRALEVLVQSAILVLPSELEPYPMSVLESLCLGTPVIVMNDAGIVNEVQNLDEDFISSPNEEILAQSIVKVVNKYSQAEKRDILAKKSMDLFDLDNIAKQCIMYYTTILASYEQS